MTVPAAAIKASFIETSFARASISAVVLVTPFLLAERAKAGLVPWRPTSLRIERIVNKAGMVTINGKRVRRGDSGISGDLVATKKTKTEIFFPNSTQGVMLDGTSFSLGKNCIQLDKSATRQRILLSGVSSVCFGKNTKANTNQTVLIVEQDAQFNYTVAVLAGNVGIDSNKDTLIAEDFDINKRFPVIAPSFELGSNGFVNAFPSSGGMLLATANTFVPLSQHRSISMLYSYSSVGSDFAGFTGVSTELGYRWLNPDNQSATSVYLGYSGFESPSCFSNLVNLGAGWERLRWRLGASAGLNTGGCQAGFSFGAINLSTPIATFKNTHVAYLSLTPYLLWGENILSIDYYRGSGVSVSPGARLSVLAPITDNLSLNTYGAVDTVYGVTVGGLLKLNFPLGGRTVRDPNLQVAKTTVAQGAGVGSTIGEAAEGFEIPEAYKAKFSPDGNRIGAIEKIRPNEFIGFVNDYLAGIAPLAESHRVAQVAAKHNALTARVSSILGNEFLEIAAKPISVSSNQPFDVTNFPAVTYSCIATDSAKTYVEQRLRANNNPEAADEVATANTVYLGPGDNSKGWPVTTSQANAYRFGNESACRQINTTIERHNKYKGPANPLGTVILP